jgi:predicted nucleic acid-binding protein
VSDTVIADTNVVSYVLKGSELGLRYAPLLRGRIIAVSFMTVAEMLYGARIADWGPARRDKLEEVLQGFLVLPYD